MGELRDTTVVFERAVVVRDIARGELRLDSERTAPAKLMKFDRRRLTPDEVHALDDQASQLMHQGISLLEDGSPSAVADALTCFDRALELRRQLPTDDRPDLRYGLAACWLNRADALIRLGDPAHIPDVLRSFDEAIVQLRDLPLKDDARYPRRLAIAHQNRGLAQLQAAGPLEAEAALTDALAVLEDESSAAIEDRVFLVAIVSLNLASAQASQQTDDAITRARVSAGRALGIVSSVEDEHASAAEIGIKARHVLCQAIARDLSTGTLTIEATRERIHDATDLVDEGLELVRRWEQRGDGRFRIVACDLFRFGARVYGTYQPHFLQEFVDDHLDPAKSSPSFVESLMANG